VAQPQQHRYSACRDADCPRLACQAWKQAWREAWDEAYREGFTDGIAACPRQHAGGR
jgi:hypothetical protein